MVTLRKLFLFIPLLAFFLAQSVYAIAIGESTEVQDQSSFRTDHRVGVGLMTGGPAGLFGFDSEVNLTESISVGATVGTGIDYTTLGFRGRFYILAKYLNPFIGFHYMYWGSNGRIARPGDINPKTIVEDLLSPGDIQHLSDRGFELHLIAPEVGVQFLSMEHFAFTGSFLFLSNIADLRGAPYGQITVSWFF